MSFSPPSDCRGNLYTCVMFVRLAEQRKHLISSLNAFAAGPNDGGDLDTAVNASEQLQRNMAEEVRSA